MKLMRPSDLGIVSLLFSFTDHILTKPSFTGHLATPLLTIENRRDRKAFDEINDGKADEFL